MKKISKFDYIMEYMSKQNSNSFTDTVSSGFAYFSGNKPALLPSAVHFSAIPSAMGMDIICKHVCTCAENGGQEGHCPGCDGSCARHAEKSENGSASRKTLDKLKVGERGRIFSIENSLLCRKKFADLGIIKGIKVSVEKIAPLGDPIDVKFRGCHLTFRKHEAVNILVDVSEE